VEFGNGLQVPLLQMPALPQMGTLQVAPCIDVGSQTQNPSMLQTGYLQGRQSGMVGGQLAATLPADQRDETATAATASLIRDLSRNDSGSAYAPRSHAQMSSTQLNGRRLRSLSEQVNGLKIEPKRPRSGPR